MFDFSRNIVVIIVQSGLKLYNFTILAAGVETEQVCNLKTGKKELKKLTLAKNSYGRFGHYCCLPQQR